jgi:hypothetical protein
MPTPGLDAGGITPEFKLLYCSWTWSGSFFFCCLFVHFSLLISFLLLLLLIFLLWVFYCYFYSFFFSFYTINFTIIIFSSWLTFPSHSHILLCYNPLLFPQQIALPLITHSLHPALTFPSHSLPTCHQITLPPLYSSPTDQPTIPTLHNPKPCNP